MRLHHLNISCCDIDSAKWKFSHLFGFYEYARKPIQSRDKNCSDYVYLLKQKNIFITLRHDQNGSVDTIDDIALLVDSISQCCKDIQVYGGTVLQNPHFIDCIQRDMSIKYESRCNCKTLTCNNFIEHAIIKSPVGNLQHSLLNLVNFTGDFLPGFVHTNNNRHDLKLSGLTKLDHIALAVPCGKGVDYMEWYRKCLKFLRFKTSVQESKSGLVIQSKHGNGLRLLTLVEHPCSDNVISKGVDESEVENDQVKLVFCESLHDGGTDQIQTFLRYHGSAGVQHVAFQTSSIIQDAQSWVANGVNFIKPPISYYKEIDSTMTKLKLKYDQSISDIGILIDAEKRDNEEGYLYQVFTSAVFESNTFFFELIQRDNARGFGAGNVSALWRALESYLQESVVKKSLS